MFKDPLTKLEKEIESFKRIILKEEYVYYQILQELMSLSHDPLPFAFYVGSEAHMMYLADNPEILKSFFNAGGLEYLHTLKMKKDPINKREFSWLVCAKKTPSTEGAASIPALEKYNLNISDNDILFRYKMPESETTQETETETTQKTDNGTTLVVA